MAESYEFGEFRIEMIWDWLVISIRNDKLCQCLWLEPDFMLLKVMQLQSSSGP